MAALQRRALGWRNASLRVCCKLEEGAIDFRLELARPAVESALAPTRRRVLHAHVLQVLLTRAPSMLPDSECGAPVSLARLVHHAAAAEDGGMVLRFAPAAAQQASAQGAHREATAHYQTALRFAGRLDVERHAELLDALASEHYLTEHHAALALWRTLGQPRSRWGTRSVANRLLAVATCDGKRLVMRVSSCGVIMVTLYHHQWRVVKAQATHA
jgi:hypothetical protein